MSITVRCQQCGHRDRVHQRLAGRTVRCRGCDAVVDVPKPEAVAAPRRQPPTVPPLDGQEPTPGGDAGGRETAEQGATGPASRRRDRRGTTANQAQPTLSAEDAAGRHRRDRPAGPPEPGPAEAVLFHDVEEEEGLRRRKRSEEELDMTPMVDVTFLLLIFFMVTASFSLQKSIQMPRQTTDLPSTSPVEEETDELDPVELEIDEFGGFYVITADFEEETPGKQNLIRTLKRAIENNNEGMQLKIRVHEMAKLQALVDAMDAGTIAGFAEIQVNQVENL